MPKSPVSVAVLAGGIGPEREVSLQSGACAARALEQSDYDVRLCDVSPDTLDCLEDTTVDVFFPVLHGAFGEDGQLQRLLEQRGLIYTGSGPEACKLAFDKMGAKAVFARQGVETPAAVVFTSETTSAQCAQETASLGERVVIKPIRQGSSVGVQIVTRDADLYDRCRDTLDRFGSCMVERFIPGHEVTVGILGQIALPVLEIRTATGVYDYHAKYEDDRTMYIVDESEAAAQLQQAALRCFHGIGLRDLARVDFILTDSGTAYALEINAIPGLTSHSLLPKAAEHAGLDMSTVCRRMVHAAVERQSEPATFKRGLINIHGKHA